jgi:hypothetical protein
MNEALSMKILLLLLGAVVLAALVIRGAFAAYQDVKKGQ